MNLSSIENRLLTYPLSLLSEYKLKHIANTLESNKINNFLEIGTWVGGSIFALSRQFPDINFITLDINDYQIMYKNNPTLVKILESWLDISIGPPELEAIQNLYKANSPNTLFCNCKDFDWNERVYDVILIDGDHSVYGVKLDLENSFKHTRHKGYIFVDDIAYPHLKREVRYFFAKKRQRVQFLSSELGVDLAMVRVRKKFKNTK